ncbi:MAG: N-acetylmuramoyl-L-alanine amidase [Patescibacteria group bacterium]
MKFNQFLGLFVTVIFLTFGVNVFGVKAQNTQSIDSSRIQRNAAIATTKKDRKALINPQFIILHHTAMSSDAAAIRELNSTLYVHYVILKTGEIVQFLPDNVVAEGSWDRAQIYASDQLGNVSSQLIASQWTRPVDSQSIHIEINYAPQKGESINYKQQQSLALLVARLVQVHNIGPTGLIGHSSIQTCGSNLFKDRDGDWFKFNEPHGLMYNYYSPNVCNGHLNPGMYNLVPMIRRYGVWKTGHLQRMNDKDVANIIYKRNINNSVMLLKKNNAHSAAKRFEQMLYQLKY